MKNKKRIELIRCFLSIVIAVTIVGICDLVARAYFYEQSLLIAAYLPLLIGAIALCLTAATLRDRNKSDALTAQTNNAGIRRVRVTGTIK